MDDHHFGYKQKFLNKKILLSLQYQRERERERERESVCVCVCVFTLGVRDSSVEFVPLTLG